MGVRRTYDSRDKRVGDVGFGWTLGLRNIRLEQCGMVGLKWCEGRANDFACTYWLESTEWRLARVTCADTNNNTVTITAVGIFHSAGKGITCNRYTLGCINNIADAIRNPKVNAYEACGDLVSYTSVFFFQAEDGIRDLIVTGVQTCA